MWDLWLYLGRPLLAVEYCLIEGKFRGESPKRVFAGDKQSIMYVVTIFTFFYVTINEANHVYPKPEAGKLNCTCENGQKRLIITVS